MPNVDVLVIDVLVDGEGIGYVGMLPVPVLVMIKVVIWRRLLELVVLIWPVWFGLDYREWFVFGFRLGRSGAESVGDCVGGQPLLLYESHTAFSN